MKRPSENIFSDGLMILLRQNLFAQTFQYFGFHGFYRLSAVNFDVFRRVFAFQLAVKIDQHFGLLVVYGKAFFTASWKANTRRNTSKVTALSR